MTKLDEILGKLSEECGELVQVCMKTQAHGLNSFNPDVTPTKTNRRHLVEECGDVMAQIDRLVATGVISKEAVQARRKMKRRKYGI